MNFNIIIYRKFGKKFIDLLMSSIVLIFSLPIWTLVCIHQVKIFKFRIFFTQSRLTVHEREFKIIKFRTMYELYSTNGQLLPDKDRIGGLGHIMRRFSVDELPNLLNVLKGDMSLVGPRPLPVGFEQNMSEAHKKRFKVKSGITGLAQINGRNNLSWSQKINYDLEYIDNYSFYLDMLVLLKTVRIVLSNKGSVNRDLHNLGIDAYMPKFDN